MLKTEFVSKIAEKTGLTKKDVVAAIDAYNSTVIEALKDGESIAMKDFGTFVTSTRKARVGRNPQTGEPMDIAASVSPKFLSLIHI